MHASNALRALSGLVLVTSMSMFAPTAAQAEPTADTLFLAGFEGGETQPPSSVALAFQNETDLRTDQTPNSAYRFDALWTDFNGDGCYEPFIFSHGDTTTSRFWVNRCDGTNTFVLADNSEINYPITSPEFPRGSGWLTLLDFNGDGRQDFWMWDADSLAARYVNATTSGSSVPYFGSKEDACNDHCTFADIDGDNQLDILHPDGSVENMAHQTLIGPASGPEGEVIALDVDGDGWMGIVQPQLGGYWHNNDGQLSWRDASLVGVPEHYAVADFDNDGDMDLFTLNSAVPGGSPARIFRNNSGNSFTDVTNGSGIDEIGFQSWYSEYGNSMAADVNNDGWQDVIVAGSSYAPSVIILRNTGDMHFVISDVDLGKAGTGSVAYKSRASVADFDNDGRLDIVKTQVSTNVGIWRNTTPTNGHWMKVRVRGEGLNTDGVGADVRWYRHGTSMLASHMSVRTSPQHPQTWLHTGLGANTRVDLEVQWPNGGPTYRFNDLSVNQEVIVYPNGCLIEQWQPGNGWPLTAPASCGN